MKIVYVAGPFRASTAWGIAENVRNAERWSIELVKRGVMPLVPHLNTQHCFGLADEKFFLEGTLELLRRCDAAVFIPGWEKSSGSVGEHEFCARVRKPLLELSSNEPEVARYAKLDRFLKTLGV